MKVYERQFTMRKLESLTINKAAKIKSHPLPISATVTMVKTPIYTSGPLPIQRHDFRCDKNARKDVDHPSNKLGTKEGQRKTEKHS